MKPKLSPWYEWPYKPALKGLYDIRLASPGVMLRCYWDGRDFTTSLGFQVIMSPGDQWRGLAEEAKG